MKSQKKLLRKWAKENGLGKLGSIMPLRLTDIGILDDLQNAEIKAWENDRVQAVETTAKEPEAAPIPAENQPETPEINLDEPMPDPQLDRRAMEGFGYADEEMLPLSKDRALELMGRDVTVYLLYGDNTEAMAPDDREIVEHGGLFGITREDWDAIKADLPPRDPEKRFEQNPEDGILIYQLKDTAPAALLFASFDRLKDAPSANDYGAAQYKHWSMP